MKFISLIFCKHPYVVSALLSFSFIFLRASGRFLNPHLWAEDGSLFLPDAIQLGWKSFYVSYAGYYHTLPRIIAYLTHFLNASFYPIFILIITVIIYISVLLTLLSDDFSYLIKESYQRLLICLALCMAPGLHEVLGNLANLHWILFFYITLTSLKDPDSKLAVWEIITLLLAIFSTGETIVLIPFLFVQLVFQFREGKKISNRTAFLFITISISVILNFMQRKNLPQGPEIQLLSIFSGWYSSVINTMILQPLIGDKYVIKLFKKYWYLYQYGSALLTIYLLFRITKQKKMKLNFFVFLLVLLSFLPLFTFLVRPYAMGVFANVHIVWNFRYAFILAPWGLLLYATLIQTLQDEKIKKYMFLILFLSTVWFNRYRFFIPEYGSENWKESAYLIDQALLTGCPNHIKIPIYPDGTDGLNVRFYFQLDLPNPIIPCK